MRNAIPRGALMWAALLVVVASSAHAADPRIDPNVSPTFQSVELNLDADQASYDGSVTMELSVASPTSAIQFHAQNMTIDRATLTGEGGEIGVDVSDEDDTGFRTATAAQELAPGKYTLSLTFHKDFNTKSVGLYRVLHEGQGYLFTQFQSVDARRAFPCFDEPAFKFPYQLTITVPTQQTAVSNTPLEKRLIGADTHTFRFKKTPPLPSYLLAIAAGPLESVAIPGLSVPGRIYTVKGQKHLTGLAAEMAPPILAGLEEYFGTKYPFEKLDLIAIPEFWPGAMENPGAVTYRDRILLLDPKNATASEKSYLAYVHAHEFAHMWFGDLVTMHWWDDLWLNESFADWAGEKIANRLYPEYKIEIEELQDLNNRMTTDARPSTAPVRRKVEKSSDIGEDLLLAYGKGKAILRMVEEWIGHDDFQAGVRHYMDKHAWGNTVAADLFDALSAASGQDLQPILAGYLEQAGYPLVTVSAAPGGVIELSQKRFANHGVESPAQTWAVPMRLKYSDGQEIYTRSLLLDKEKERIEVGTNVAWILPDEGAFGYYRWNVPTDMLIYMSENPKETLSEREGARFLGNAKSLLLAGEIGGDEYLTLISSFASYTEPHIITSILDDLGTVRGALVTPEMEDEFAAYVRQTLRPALDRYGMEEVDGERETVTLLRPRLLAWLGDYGRDPEVKERCKKLTAMYLEDPESVEASIASVAMRVTFIDGTMEDFEMIKAKAEAAKVPAQRSRYLRTLGTFDDPEIQLACLNYSISDAVRLNERWTVTGRITNSTEGRALAYQWTKENYEKIVSRLPEEFQPYMAFIAGGCSQDRLADAREFFADPERNVEGLQRNLEKVAESVTDCVNLREREGAAVADYLTRLAAAR